MTEQESVCQVSTDGPVVTIALNRPDSMNGFNGQLRSELADALSSAASDDSVRAVVLTGSGRAFSAGADLGSGMSGVVTVEQQLQREYRPSLHEIVTMAKPVIAAINGAAAGIGMSYALACDLAVMSENAFLLSPFTNIGLVPDGGATFMLQHHLGYKRAFQLSVECERIDAATCLREGLVNRVVPADQVLQNAQQWGQELSKRAPLSIAATKRTMREAQAGGGWAKSFDLEAEIQSRLVGSEDNIEGVDAFFAKRAPQFKGQ